MSPHESVEMIGPPGRVQIERSQVPYYQSRGYRIADEVEAEEPEEPQVSSWGLNEPLEALED